MFLSILTYNILFNKAIEGIDKVTSQYQPDVICLQEVDTREENLNKLVKNNYLLADFTNSFVWYNRIFGLATFFNSEKIIFKNSDSVNIYRGIIESLWFFINRGKFSRAALKTEFLIKSVKRKMAVYNIHLSSYDANSAKLRQIKETFADIDGKTKNPTFIVGDFNYPYGRKKFENLIKKNRLKEATNNLFYTYEQKILGLFTIRFKNDYVLYKNIKTVETIRIPVKGSDHFPILAKFEI